MIVKSTAYFYCIEEKKKLSNYFKQTIQVTIFDVMCIREKKYNDLIIIYQLKH